MSLLYGSYVPDVSPINSLASTGFWNLAPYTVPTTGFNITFCGTNLRVSSVLVLITNPLIGSLAFSR